MRKTAFLLTAAVCIAALPLAARAASAVKPTAAFGVYPSSSTPGGIAPTHNQSDAFYQYTYTVPSGSQIVDTIPVKVCIDGSTLGADQQGSLVHWSDDIAGQITGGLDGVTMPTTATPLSFNDTQWNGNGNGPPDGFCQDSTITVSTGPLTHPGIAVIQLKTQNQNPASGSTALQDSFDTPAKIHIFVRISGTTNDAITCFLTDSDGNFLLRSDGITPASDPNDTTGTFGIVLNAKKRVVATNPGQFYLNVFWDNLGAQTSVDVQFNEGGSPPLVTNGVQANHWWTFQTLGFTGLTQANFNTVNEGNPAGKTSFFTANPVPAADTLYVTRHLEWSGLGSSNPATPVVVTVAAKFTPASTGVPLSCTAGATGYLAQ